MDSEEALKMIKDMLENSVANPSVYSTRRKSLSPDLLVNLQATACIVVQVENIEPAGGILFLKASGLWWF